MKCVKCAAEITCRLSILTEEEDRPIEKSYQWWACENCGTKYYGILEDSHVNMFDDRLLHQGYIAEEDNWQERMKWGLQCPEPRNSSCKCVVHRTISSSDFLGEFAWYTYD